MIRDNLIICLLLLFCSIIFASEELPDVEITGPSVIKSILEKRGLPYPDLLINDVVDSLQPIMPVSPYRTPRNDSTNKNFFTCEISNNFGFKASVVSDNLFKTPLLLSAKIDRRILKDEWNSTKASAGLLIDSKNNSLETKLKISSSKSAYSTDIQNINAIEVNYHVNKVKLLGQDFSMYLKGEVQSEQEQNSDNTESPDVSFFNGIGLITDINKSLTVVTQAQIIEKTPFLAFRLGFNNKDMSEKTNLIRSVSFFLSEDHVVPGVHLSKRFFIDDYNILYLYQNSDYRIYDHYSKYLDLPWQKRSDPVITYQPLNAHIVLSNQSIPFHNSVLQLYCDLGLQYKMNEPTYSALSESDLPSMTPVNVLKNNLKVTIMHSGEHISFAQSGSLDKGWMVENDNDLLPYLPLVGFHSEVAYKKGIFGYSASLEQYYQTKDETGKHLGDAIELGSRADFTFSKNLQLYAKLTNLLNKGKFVHRNIPTEPRSISAGFMYSF